MRKLSIVAIAAVLLTSACTRKTNDNSCANVLCTAIFAAVSVQVTDANGQPVIFDEVYSERIPTGERISFQQSMASGYYVVLDDGYRSKLFNTKANFHFIGKKNGNVVVDEIYTISADCCHVKKESGREMVTVN